MSNLHSAIVGKPRLESQISFGHHNEPLFAILPSMQIDPVAIGRRIEDLRLGAGYRNQAALAAKLVQQSQKKGGENKLNAETVRRWEKGKTIPPWDKVEQLCELFEIEAEVLLFGEKRLGQLRAARPRLVYVTSEEADLLELVRNTSLEGQKSILSAVRGIQTDNPAADADFHILKPRKPR